MDGSGPESPKAAVKQPSRLVTCSLTPVPGGTAKGLKRSGAAASSPTVTTSSAARPGSAASLRYSAASAFPGSMTRNGIPWSVQSWRRISAAVAVLPLPAAPTTSAGLASARSGTATSRPPRDTWPSRIAGPVSWYAVPGPKRPRRTGKPGTTPSTATGNRNAQPASLASPSTLSIASCGSGGSWRPQISCRPVSIARLTTFRLYSASRRSATLPGRRTSQADRRGSAKPPARSAGEMASATASTMPGGSCLGADTWIRSANAFCDSRRAKSWKVFSASTANASGASRVRPP